MTKLEDLAASIIVNTERVYSPELAYVTVTGTYLYDLSIARHRRISPIASDSWHPDGKGLVGVQIPSDQQCQTVVLIDMDGNTTPVYCMDENVREPKVSPNGRHIAWVAHYMGDNKHQDILCIWDKGKQGLRQQHICRQILRFGWWNHKTANDLFVLGEYHGNHNIIISYDMLGIPTTWSYRGLNITDAEYISNTVRVLSACEGPTNSSHFQPPGPTTQACGKSLGAFNVQPGLEKITIDPTGKHVAYNWRRAVSDCCIRIVNLDAVCCFHRDVEVLPGCMSWSYDGRYFAYSDIKSGAIQIVDAEGMEETSAPCNEHILKICGWRPYVRE